MNVIARISYIHWNSTGWQVEITTSMDTTVAAVNNLTLTWFFFCVCASCVFIWVGYDLSEYDLIILWWSHFTLVMSMWLHGICCFQIIIKIRNFLLPPFRNRHQSSPWMCVTASHTKRAAVKTLFSFTTKLLFRNKLRVATFLFSFDLNYNSIYGMYLTK